MKTLREIFQGLIVVGACCWLCQCSPQYMPAQGAAVEFPEVQDMANRLRSMPESAYSQCLQKCVKNFQSQYSDILSPESKKQLYLVYQSCADDCMDLSDPNNPGGGSGPGCSEQLNHMGAQYQVVCAAGKCSCKKDGREQSTCDMPSSNCAFSTSSQSVQAACCLFPLTPSGVTNPPGGTTNPPVTNPPVTNPPVIPPVPVQASCSGNTTVNQDLFEMVCTNDNCSCKQNGQETSQCSMAGMTCATRTIPTMVDAACCHFPLQNAGSGYCRGLASITGNRLRISCQGDLCTCNKNGTDIGTCQATNPECRFKGTATSVEADCCKF